VAAAARPGTITEGANGDGKEMLQEQTVLQELSETQGKEGVACGRR